MPTTWLPGWQHITPTKPGATPRRPGAPPRLVLHSDEVPTAVMRRLFEQHPWPPQLWGDLRTGEALQGIPLDRTGYALAAVSGTETNHQGNCVQIELHMRAADAPWLPDDQLMLLGAWVEQICAARGIPLVAWLPTRGPEAYGAGAPGRMTRHQWETFSGVCLHQHVHGNSHWDTGALNLPRVIEWAQFIRHHRTISPSQGAPAVSDALTRTSYLSTVAAQAGVDRGPLISGTVDIGSIPRYVTPADLAALERKLLATVDEIPTGATGPEVAQIVADEVDRIVARLDGLTVDGREVTGADVRQLLLELLGAAPA